MTNTSPEFESESEAVERRRTLHMIITLAMAVMDDDDDDPLEESPTTTTHQL
jgi:hypothetical protein